MNGSMEKSPNGSAWRKILSLALACLVAIGAIVVAGSASADAAYAASSTGYTDSVVAGSVKRVNHNMPKFNLAYRGKVIYSYGHYYCYDTRGYLIKNRTVKTSKYIIWCTSSGAGNKLKNQEARINGRYYLCDRSGNLVKGRWDHDRFYSSKDGHRLSGACIIWHSKTAYNRYYFRPQDGVRALDFAYKGYYYRASDGVGIAFGSNEYNYLILKELNRQRTNNRMSALWWSGGSLYNSYVMGCANMAMISFNDYMNCRAHANTNRMNSLFSWRSEYQDYMCYSQFNCCTPRAIVNGWARTTGYYSPLAYRWTHVGIHTRYSNGRYYYTLELERNKTIR